MHGVGLARAAYTITIYALAKWMARRDRFKLVLVTRYHNLLLCIWSLLMCVGATSVLVNAVRRGYTWTDVVCDNRNGRGHLMVSTQLGFWAWSYYVSKFYELFDTVLAVSVAWPALHDAGCELPGREWKACGFVLALIRPTIPAPPTPPPPAASSVPRPTDSFSRRSP